MLVSPRDDPPGTAAFLEGYRTFREFEDHWLDLIEPLRAMRYVYYAAWIARRFDDPAFPAAFPHFGTDAYWEQETQDLEEHALIVRRTDPSEPAPQEPEELSNKDFFWDWEGE